MEEEKQQVLNKIAKIRRKVEDIPNHEVWLEAAKNLRMEQQKETLISEKTKDQRFQLSNAEKKLNSVQQSLKDAKAAFSNAGPDTLYNNMEKEHKMNKYLVSENLPKLIQDGKSQSKELTKILSQPASSNKDLAVFEKEIKELNEEIAMLAEKRLLLNNSGEDKLALFRQQAAIIARKKEGKAQRLAALHEEINSLTVELEKKKESSKNSGVKIMKGEEFKKYVNDLRGKSTVYKRKKAEISEIIAEFGILQRTEEILKGREKTIQLKIQELEKKSGVSGFHAAQDNLEKVSERKGELDQVKGKTLSEISEIVQNLMKSINDKKTKLSPIIQELRTIRQAVQELESAYSEKKKQYDATMVGLDSDNIQLEQEVKGYRQDIINDQSRYHYLQQMCHVVDIAQDKIFHEIKAYIGGDDSMDAIQKQRGFKSYRDLYNKKITEQENLGKNLREQQKDVRTNFEPNVKQLAMFSDLEKLLALKLSCNKKVLAAGRTNNTDIQGAITQERLVL
ncbi:Intraflagellar transport protein 81 [Nowakowskiella sp. JEL0407]|nr:Intraflagellar transport protein 81 [Nowakowskiella sp. JEL0407]